MLIHDQVGLALLSTLALLCLILIFPILGASRRRSREKRRPRPQSSGAVHPERHVPDYDYDARDVLSRWRAGEAIPENGLGSAQNPSAAALWFSLGVLVGAAGMALWAGMNNSAPVISVDGGPRGANRSFSADNTVNEGSSGSVARPDSEPTSASSAAGPKMAAAFINVLKTRLPMAVGEAITMVRAEASDGLVTLAFDVSKGIANDDVFAFEETARASFLEGLCKRNIGGMRDLTDSGVEFRLIYVDQSLRTVADLRFGPTICSN